MSTRSTISGGLSPEARRAWQHRGRCVDEGHKVTGTRRVRSCVCGSKVRY